MTGNTRILITTITLLLFTSCGRREAKYVFKKPVATIQNIKTRTTVPDMMQVSTAELSINITLQYYQVAMATEYKDLVTHRAMATSIKPPDKENIEHIADVIVRPQNNYGTLNANSDISERCIFFRQNNDTVSKAQLISWLNDDQYVDWDFDMKSITIAPQILITANTQQQFIIEFITERGAKLSDTTTTVIITP